MRGFECSFFFFEPVLTAACLIATTGQPIVRSLSTLSGGSTTLIVAGSFTSAGSTQCIGICAFDTNAQTWSALGSGTSGDVESVTYAGVRFATLSSQQIF